MGSSGGGLLRVGVSLIAGGVSVDFGCEYGRFSGERLSLLASAFGGGSGRLGAPLRFSRSGRVGACVWCPPGSIFGAWPRFGAFDLGMICPICGLAGGASGRSFPLAGAFGVVSGGVPCGSQDFFLPPPPPTQYSNTILDRYMISWVVTACLGKLQYRSVFRSLTAGWCALCRVAPATRRTVAQSR